MIGDFGFLFLDVLLVIILIERLLTKREKEMILKKLNMVIGAFFSEVGLELLKRLSEFMIGTDALKEKMLIDTRWGKKEFREALKSAKSFSYEIKVEPLKLAELRNFLHEKQSFMLRLLENPNLLEHEHFTDFLWAVFHLSEELTLRGRELENLPQSDYEHLAGDLKRACSLIIEEWIAYTSHLKEKYPFLYSLAVRINPLNPSASPIVR